MGGSGELGLEGVRKLVKEMIKRHQDVDFNICYSVQLSLRGDGSNNIISTLIPPGFSMPKNVQESIFESVIMKLKEGRAEEPAVEVTEPSDEIPAPKASPRLYKPYSVVPPCGVPSNEGYPWFGNGYDGAEYEL